MTSLLWLLILVLFVVVANKSTTTNSKNGCWPMGVVVEGFVIPPSIRGRAGAGETTQVSSLVVDDTTDLMIQKQRSISSTEQLQQQHQQQQREHESSSAEFAMIEDDIFQQHESFVAAADESLPTQRMMEEHTWSVVSDKDHATTVDVDVDIDIDIDTVRTAMTTSLATTKSKPTTTTTSKTSKNRKSFTPFQHMVRTIPVATAAFYWYDPTLLDELTSKLWSYIYNWNIAQLPLFEAEVAVFGFVTWIILFSSLHLLLGEEKTKEARLDHQLPHNPFEWAQPANWQLWFNPIVAYLGSIYIYIHYFHTKPPLPIEAPTFGVLVGETLFGIVMYDVCFMPVHWAMHHSPIRQLKKIHGYHHRSGTKTLNAVETVQHSYLDGFMQVFVNIMVQQISPFGGGKHVLSRLFHNIIVTYLLSEAHSGYSEVEWFSHQIFPELLGGAPRHEAHHHNGRVYYQQYFKYLDDFFGFVIEEKEDEEQFEHNTENTEFDDRINTNNGETNHTVFTAAMTNDNNDHGTTTITPLLLFGGAGAGATATTTTTMVNTTTTTLLMLQQLEEEEEIKLETTLNNNNNNKGETKNHVFTAAMTNDNNNDHGTTSTTIITPLCGGATAAATATATATATMVNTTATLLM